MQQTAPVSVSAYHITTLNFKMLFSQHLKDPNVPYSACRTFKYSLCLSSWGENCRWTMGKSSSASIPWFSKPFSVGNVEGWMTKRACCFMLPFQETHWLCRTSTCIVNQLPFTTWRISWFKQANTRNSASTCSSSSSAMGNFFLVWLLPLFNENFYAE